MVHSSKGLSNDGWVLQLVFWFLSTAFGLVLIGAYEMSQPQDLSDLKAGVEQTQDAPARDMKVVLQNSVERGYSLSLSEAEVNRWLGRVLEGRQAGLLKSLVKLERVWVRFEDGLGEVIFERRVLGRVVTCSMFLTVGHDEIELHGGPYRSWVQRPMRGGRFGRLVIPQGFLILVRPAFVNLAKLFDEEIDLGFHQMKKIQFLKRRLILDPREEVVGGGLLNH
jgi:hypothetical protein